MLKKTVSVIILLILANGLIFCKADDSLISAAGNNDLAGLKSALDNGAEINTKDDEGWTALMWASDKGYEKIAEYLVSRGADINARDNYGWTALMYACAFGRVEIVKLLVTHNANENTTSARKQTIIDKFYPRGTTAFRIAKISGNNDLTRLLGNNAVSMRRFHPFGKRVPASALKKEFFDAVINMDIEGVNSALKKGIDVNSTDINGWTALMITSENGDTKMAELLLSGGTNINAKDQYGKNSLIIACLHGHEELARLLISKGADVNVKDNNGYTPLMWTDSSGIAGLLISKGADSNAKGKNCTTALMIACENGKQELAEYLIGKGADMNIKNNDGYTALDLADINGFDDIVNMLIKDGTKK